jgi:hypothetical protein
MSLGTPRRMKMTYRYPATKQQYRLLLQRGWSRGRFLLGAARLQRSWTRISEGTTHCRQLPPRSRARNGDSLQMDIPPAYH